MDWQRRNRIRRRRRRQASRIGMVNGNTYRDTLFYAAAIAGSEQGLAARLEVPVRQVEDWLTGIESVPEPIFQAALDVVIGSSPQAIFRSRGLLQRLAR